MGGILDAVLWLIALELLNLAVLPLALRVFFGLPDRGYAFARILGLILIGYAAWVTGILGLTAFTGATLVVVTLVLAAAVWWAWGREVRHAWESMRPLALGAEAMFLVTFIGAVVIRAFNAPIAGQEKQMDLTFINALIQSSSLPAPDLWMAGFGMPYYYFGYLIQSLLPKVLPIDPAVAYNLGVATVLALAATGTFGLGASLVHLAGGGKRLAWAFGALGAFVLTIMGNLEALFEWIAGQGMGDPAFWSAMAIKISARTANGVCSVGIPGPNEVCLLSANSQGFPSPQDAGWWFHAARVIPNIQPDGITEFPYFSFILGDLHPHYMAIPLGILIVGIAIHELIVGQSWRRDPVRLGVAAIVMGAVIPSNTWDVPVLWGVVALALAATALREENPVSALIARAEDLILAVFIGVICYLPYFVGYTSQPLGFALTGERTMFGSLFVLFGPLLVLPLMAGGLGLAGRIAESEQQRVGMVALFVGSMGGLALAALSQPTLGFLVGSLFFWVVLTWLRARAAEPAPAIAVGILTIAGLGSILIPEVVFLRDAFQSRMNSVFKFYYDAWILLALAAPLLTWELVTMALARAREVRTAVRPLAAASAALAALLMLAGAIYPIAATRTKSGGEPTLDGMIHLRTGRAEDAAAIEWLKRTRPGGIVEAVGNDYTDAARISTFAGVPALLGWIGHEDQWRGPVPEITRRRELARRIYTDADPAQLRPELQQVGIRYIVLGSMEREVYGPTAGANLDQSFRVAQRLGNTTIYDITEAGS